jgi:serine/threonine protein kinase
MLTGKFPRPNKPGVDPAGVILYEKAIPLRQTDPQITPELANIIDRALAFDPRDRYQTAYDMLGPLTRLLS